MKGRLTKENSEIEMLLDYQTGLDKYYGLCALAEKYGIFTKTSTRYETPAGKAYEKAIMKEPEKYFTKDVMKKLEDAAIEEFHYGSRKND